MYHARVGMHAGCTMMTPAVRDALIRAGAKVVETFDGVRIELPPRGPRRGVGISLMFVGALMVGMSVIGLTVLMPRVVTIDGPARGVMLLLCLPMLGVFLTGVALLNAGQAAYAGTWRSIIEAGGGRLRVTERLGVFRHSWVRPVEKLFNLRLVCANLFVHGAGRGGEAPSYTALMVEDRGGASVWIAPLYRTMVLEPLCDALSESCGLSRSPRTARGESDSLTASVPSTASEEGRPPHTKVKIIEQSDALAIDAPSPGLIRGSHGLFVFSLVWIIFSLLWCGVVVVRGGAEWGAMGAGLVFVVLGVVCLGWSVRMGCQRVMMAIDSETILIRRLGGRQVREEKYARADLMAVRCGPSGLKVNNRPIMELQFHFRNCPTVRCGSYLSDSEVRWLAAKLQSWLGLTERTDALASG